MSNPAYERLLQDYVAYHLALVVVGGFFTLALLGFAVFSWVRARRAPKGVERRSHLAFAAASSVVGLLLAVVVAGNLSSVLNPRQGLAGVDEGMRYELALFAALRGLDPDLVAGAQRQRFGEQTPSGNLMGE